MKTDSRRYVETYDLTNCDAEPLRFIRSCQSHAIVLVAEVDNLRVIGASENARDRFGEAANDLLGLTLGEVLNEELFSQIQTAVRNNAYDNVNPIMYAALRPSGVMRENVLLHPTGEHLILEFEERDESFQHARHLTGIDHALRKIQAGQSEEEIFRTTVKEVKQVAGYDRVMLYRFDDEYNGEVIAEEKEPGMPPYLNLRYPHTDIPEQARKLYLEQQLRHIVSTDASAESFIVFIDDAPVNLSPAANRGVSPIHLEYLRTMGVGASMSIAIIVEGRLWGLLACHHRTRKLVDYRLRMTIGFLGRVISGHIAMHQGSKMRGEILSTNLVRSKLMDQMNASLDLKTALFDKSLTLLDLIRAEGVVMKLGEEITTLGSAPSQETILAIEAFLEEKQENVYHTNALSQELPEIADQADVVSGILAIRIGRKPPEYIIWVRPEKLTTVTWGGSPQQRKIIEDGAVRLHPELSFARWTEEQRGLSEEWEQHYIDSGLALRNDIKEVILQKYQEIRELNDNLVSAYDELESFSYTVSHDLRAPLRSIKGFAEILQEDYLNSLDDYGQYALTTIINNIGKMNGFINDILAFSQLGQSELVADEVELEGIIRDLWKDLEGDKTEIALKVKLDHPVLRGDYHQIRQVFLNLISNSIKYARKEVSSWIRIQSSLEEDRLVLIIEDNGIGFNMKYAERIFAVFSRLVSDDAYEGTGVGLAIVKRIVDKHQGTIEVSSELGVGTRFILSFPAIDGNNTEPKLLN